MERSNMRNTDLGTYCSLSSSLEPPVLYKRYAELFKAEISTLRTKLRLQQQLHNNDSAL